MSLCGKKKFKRTERPDRHISFVSSEEVFKQVLIKFSVLSDILNVTLQRCHKTIVKKLLRGGKIFIDK